MGMSLLKILVAGVISVKRLWNSSMKCMVGTYIDKIKGTYY